MIEIEKGTVKIQPSDWRWSASIVGLVEFFKHFHIEYNLEEEYIEFEEDSIDKESYLKFVEYFFEDKMHHRTIEKLLSLGELSEEEIKIINEKLSANSIMKTVMGKIKYEDNKEVILQLIDKNRNEIIESTFKGGQALYANFCNKGNLFDEKGSTCRLVGYYVDKGRKIQALSYGTDKNTFVYQDSKYFDFIPFGFSRTREAFFVNNNFTIEQLIRTNKKELCEDEKINISNFLYRVKNSAMFIDYDVEVIKKEREKDYYETVFVRKNAIEIFKNIDMDVLEVLRRPCNKKKSEKAQDDWVDVEKIVTNNILNNIKLDTLIENLFKAYNNYKYLIYKLIQINQLIYKEDYKMKADHKKAYEAALDVQKVLASKRKTKIKSYEQRLISAISLKDYDKVKEILIHLSAYTQVRMDFLISVFENFEENKNLVYTFINTLGEKNQTIKTSEKGENK